MESLHVVFVFPVGCVSTPGGKQKKEPGHGEKAGTKMQGDSVEAESSFGELEVPKTDQLTETDPVKKHEGVPREDEPENKKKNQATYIRLNLIFWLNRWGLSLLLGSLKSLKKTN